MATNPNSACTSPEKRLVRPSGKIKRETSMSTPRRPPMRASGRVVLDMVMGRWFGRMVLLLKAFLTSAWQLMDALSGPQVRSTMAPGPTTCLAVTAASNSPRVSTQDKSGPDFNTELAKKSSKTSAPTWVSTTTGRRRAEVCTIGQIKAATAGSG